MQDCGGDVEPEALAKDVESFVEALNLDRKLPVAKQDHVRA